MVLAFLKSVFLNMRLLEVCLGELIQREKVEKTDKITN